MLTEKRIELRIQPGGLVESMRSKPIVPPVTDAKEPIKLQVKDVATL